MGITFDRPSMLNKRNFVRDTGFDEEIVNTGGKIEEIKEERV